MNGDSDGARDVVNRLFEATNAHDVESLRRCFAEDYVNETPLPPSGGFHGGDQAVASAVGAPTSGRRS
jgi:ketosteroid isomerase-like protein